jgi:predicted TIM-barrel fold metal-dependent hydrolase
LDALLPYLPERWREHARTIGLRGHTALAKGYDYPKGTEAACRVDAWPESGPPGSDLALMRRQHLDPLGIGIGVLNCLFKVGAQLNHEWEAALARAVNDWQVAEWLEKEARLRASIVIPYEHPDAAVEEMRRAVRLHPGFVQALILVRTREPLGRPLYRPIFETAVELGMPVGLHFGAIGGNAVTPCGWPSFYLEEHTGMSLAFQTQLVSLVLEGVFERLQALRVVLVEGGFAWIPPLTWRMDQHWRRLRAEAPYLRRAPSEYVRTNVALTTQPMEEPENPRHLLDLLEMMAEGPRLMFATDYPHWDFDAPDRAFPVPISDDLRAQIYETNARQIYRL